jgi:hypothetical protein
MRGIRGTDYQAKLKGTAAALAKRTDWNSQQQLKKKKRKTAAKNTQQRRVSF